MAEAKQREAWMHTASVMCLFANCHRDPSRMPVSIETFLPEQFRRELREERRTSAPDFTALKPYFQS